MASFEKRGRRWQCRVYSQVLKRTVARSAATKREALARADKRRRELEGGILFDAQNLTVAEYLHHWLAQHGTHASARTVRRYGQLAELHIIPHIGDRKMGRLHPMEIQDLYARAAVSGRRDGKSGGLHPRTIVHVHRVLHKALEDAVRLKMVAGNVARAVIPPTVPRRVVEVPSIERVLAVLRAVEGTPVEYEVRFAAFTGVRQGELLGLRWSDVDLDGQTARITRSVTRMPNVGILVVPTKTRTSDRVVPLAPDLVRALRGHRGRQIGQRLLAGPEWDDRDLVFPSATGTEQDPRNVLRRFHRALEQAGVARMRWHDLRHCCASLMLSAGVPLAIVSELLGHASIQVTKDTYGHIAMDAKHEAARALEAVLTR